MNSRGSYETNRRYHITATFFFGLHCRRRIQQRTRLVYLAGNFRNSFDYRRAVSAFPATLKATEHDQTRDAS